MATAVAPSASRDDFHVLIIGAGSASCHPLERATANLNVGVTGLLLAQALQESEISYSIFDTEDPTALNRTREWGMSIHWSRPMLDRLLPPSLLARLSEAQVDPWVNSIKAEDYTVPFYNGKTGEHIVEVPMRNNVRVSRRKMRSLLREGVDIQFGQQLEAISHADGGVTVTFASGRAEKGSIVIGTDGPQSKVRQILLGEKAATQQVGLILYNLNVCYGNAERALKVRSLHPVNTVALQPDRGLSVWTSIQDVPDPDKPETWSFQVMPTWMDDGKKHKGGAEGLAELKEIALSLVDPWKSSLLWIPEGTEVTPNNVAYWVTVPWDNQAGTVTLAGDAAHPLPPHRGQGLNHCIADVTNLRKAILDIKGGRSQPDAISVYDAELVTRGGAEVEMSRKNSLLVHDLEKFMESPVLKMGYVRGKN
ncbi:hypothetical protein BP5796_13210 [Coleophoma crateriformis]|uniref:FAD-binding domain-containing protein n=1 Tax=Coleophoma crateriformis TaxID=565419 RepID=A0A3D8Q420_9HELO|nr:hypothetical protein BP5796_13210 [Coleophoma crateriformis]